jgi:flagellar motor switch/type III secretory pathway protein FliN
MSARAQAVPILLLGEGRRQRLLARVTGVVGEWHAQWASEGIEPPRVELSGPGAPLASVGRETLRLAAVADGVPLLFASAATDFVKRLCGGSRERTLASWTSPRAQLEEPLTEEVTRALCLGLIRAALPLAIFSVRRCDGAELERARSGAHSRALGLLILPDTNETGCGIELTATPHLVEALLGQRPKHASDETLVARRQAAEEERVSLSVTLGSASVTWRDLRSLGIGDAIVLDQPLDAACKVSVSGSGAIAEAHLGRAGKSLAIQIARVHGAPPERQKRGMR